MPTHNYDNALNVTADTITYTTHPYPYWNSITSTTPLTTNEWITASELYSPKYATVEDMENLKKKIYEVLRSLTQIDITEEEFLELLNE